MLHVMLVTYVVCQLPLTPLPVDIVIFLGQVSGIRNF
jgi:hypothetical protein